MDSTKPRISIGLPVYNGEDYVAETIELFLAQSFEDFELIVSDNGSADGTQEICEFFAQKDSRICYYRSDENRGLTWNFNRVFELSRGDYFKWAAYDDLCGVTFLEKCVEVLDWDPTVVVCCPSSAAVDESGCLIELSDEHANRQSDPMGIKQLDDGRWHRRLDSDKPHVRFHSVLIDSTRCYEEFGVMRSEAIRTIGPRGNYGGSEKVFLAHLSLLGRIVILPEKLFFPRWHEKRYSANASAADHSEFIDPKKSRRFILPRRLRCTLGYCSLLYCPKLSARERLLCATVLLRFMLQVAKWRPIVGEMITGVRPTLRIPANSRRLGRPDALTIYVESHRGGLDLLAHAPECRK